MKSLSRRVNPAPLALASVSIILLAAIVTFSWLGPASGVVMAGDEDGFPACKPVADFAMANFSNPTSITNSWLPMVPGTQFILEGEANRTGELSEAKIIFTITDLVKEVNGINTVVVWDQDFNGGELAEEELAFFAQDDDGNVWSMGEYPEEKDEETGEIGAPYTWIPGIGGAQAGVMMKADPQIGTPWYLQGWVPEIDFLDCAKVHQKGQVVEVPQGSYDNVLVNRERSPLAHEGGVQVKYYAENVGNIEIGAIGDPEGETMKLVAVLGGADVLDEGRAGVLALECHAYNEHISEVYSETDPVFDLDDCPSS